MKYFAQIEGEQKGPFTLDELVEAGVRPDTYVWCKEMSDWQQARDVADICRRFRQRIADLNHPVVQAPAPVVDVREEEKQRALSELPPAIRYQVERSGTEPGPSLEPTPDYSRAPQPMLFPAILTTLLCFPFTGFVAIYFALDSRKQWRKAEGAPEKVAEEMRKAAHSSARQAKMWTGITFFMGFIFAAFLSRLV